MTEDRPTSEQRCDSCGMPLPEERVAANRYCEHCAPGGVLQPFEERFERMTQWVIRRDGLDRADAEARTREYMRTMPAWRDHPALA